MNKDRAESPGRAWKRWVRLVLAGTIAIILTIAGMNMFLDAYGVRRTGFQRQFREPNKQFFKIKFLLEHKDKYDSFLFGSSRVNDIDVKAIAPGSYYNMTYSEGLPQEHLANLRFLIEHGVHVRTVVVGLDDFSYRVSPRIHNDLLHQPYPALSGKSWTQFYAEYYLKLKRLIPDFRDYIVYAVTGKDSEGKRTVQDLLDSGRTFCVSCDDEIEADPERHLRDPKFLKPFHYDGNNLEEAMAAIRGLVQLAHDRGFNLVFFINPIHQTTYLDTDMPLFDRFKRELARTTDYYDFSGLNSITTDNYYYHSTSHYRGKVGYMILNRIFGTAKAQAPPDFGVLVTARNVEQHLAQLNQQLRMHGQARMLSATRGAESKNARIKP